MPDLRKSFTSLAVFFLGFFPGCIFAQSSDSTEIYLFEYREGFFNIPFYIDTLSATRTFNYEDNYSATRCLYFNYGPYRCYFYCEPGKKYRVHLPDISSADTQWKENPYFEPLSIHCKIEIPEPETATKELNDAIRDFDSKYEPFLSRQALRYYNVDYAKSQLDSFISVAFPDIKVSDPEYFQLFREYKKALLYYHGKHRDLDNLIQEYLLNKPLYFNIPSYRLFLSLSLSNYFDYLQRKDNFNNIYSNFSRLSVYSLQSYLSQDTLLSNDTLREMVLLKECYNAWYSETTNRKRILEITDSIGITSERKIIKRISEFLMKKFTFLRPGYPSVNIHSIDLNGDSVIIDDNNPELILLGFCDLNSIECIKEIEFLKYLQSKHDKHIEIITVLKAGNMEQLRSIKQDERVSWQVINWDEWPGIAKEYQVKAVPSFFLIDINGKILQNPARNPSDNFEYELFLILRMRGEV